MNKKLSVRNASVTNLVTMQTAQITCLVLCILTTHSSLAVADAPTTKLSTSAAAHQPSYPDLPEAISSFGGVVCGDSIYVYSGHTGKAHDHSKHNLSQNFHRISRTQPTQWESLPFESPLQGLALVAYGEQVYRIGGLQAFNDDVDSPDLHSSETVSRFDPNSKQWTSLTPLPSARSSHDAVVIRNQVYVVGGWKLAGDGDEGTWHDHALVADLRENPIRWKPIEVPYRRRALATSSYQNKLYVIGGMNEDHDIVRTVSVYDPADQTWSEGPELPGEGMNGFGVSAWNLNGKLFVSGSDGRLHRLSDDATQWQTVAQLKTPRFFHQLLPARPGAVLAVGGASMKLGHLKNLEVVVVGDHHQAASVDRLGLVPRKEPNDVP